MISFYHQKKSIERYNVVKCIIILCWFNFLDLFFKPRIRRIRIRNTSDTDDMFPQVFFYLHSKFHLCSGLVEKFLQALLWEGAFPLTKILRLKVSFFELEKKKI